MTKTTDFYDMLSSNWSVVFDSVDNVTIGE